MEHLYKCDECGKHTRFIKLVERLPNEIEHHFAECEHCSYRSTIFYTNPKIRNLMFQQRHTNFGTQRKFKLTEKIKRLTTELKEKLEV